MDDQRSRWGKTRSVRGVCLALLGVLVLGLNLALPSVGSAAPETRSQSSQAPQKTVVSLTFDDGQATQYSVLPVLRSHRMPATFYVNSGMVGSSKFYMTWQQIFQLSNAGNEIGGHTSHHVVLSQVNEALAVSEICGDRKRLIQEGLAPVTSFAYPTAAQRRSTSAVKSCGYSSARGVGGTGAQLGEDIPPLDVYRLRTPDDPRIDTTVQDIERKVTRAGQAGVPWVILVFHGICSNLCTSQETTTPAVFRELLDWLAAQRSAGNIEVRTVGDVIANGAQASSTAPQTTITCEPSACSDSTSHATQVKVSLQATGTPGDVATYYTTDGTNPKTSASWQLYTHPFTVPGATTVRFYSRDAASRSEPVHTQRIQAGVAVGVGDGQTPGLTSSRVIIAGFSGVMFIVVLAGGIALLWRNASRRRARLGL